MKKWILPILIAIVIGALVFSVIGYGFYWAFFDIQRYEGHEDLFSLSSPTKAYTLTAYRNNGGGNSGYAILFSITNNANGETRNIYWDGDATDADVQWLDGTTVVINGRELNVNEDVYDYRREKEILPGYSKMP